jgi:hypothetical protein
VWERLKLTGLTIWLYAVGFWQVIFPVVLWLAVAWVFDISFVITLLVFIAVNLNAMGLAHKTPDAPKAGGKRDFYVVIDTNYTWNPLENNLRPRDAKPDTLDAVYAFDSFDAAKAMCDSVSREHYRWEDCFPWLEHPEPYLDGSRYEEYEARLWVIPATSKQEAHDKARYHDRRRLLGGDGWYASDEHLLFITDTEKRRSAYIAWWRDRKDYQRYLDRRASYLKDNPQASPGCWELDFSEWQSPDDIADGVAKMERHSPGRPSGDKEATAWYETRGRNRGADN